MPDFASEFETVLSTTADGKYPVTKLKSKQTGLTVVVAEVDGPLVNGYFVLATEAFDDDGLPHTLEHLIFLGSEDYPYKGVLDTLSNRCLSSGTNAWTDTDHTCYTMTTAGTEGFLNLFPIYVEHILFPTLSDSGYITEVHHINGEGEDGGIVYSEMQGRENTGESRVHLEMLRAMYPGNCGYKSETGGIMKNLRESTNNKKVYDYHKEFYRPENLCLIVAGKISVPEVKDALSKIEKRIVEANVHRPSYVRPWQNPVPALTESVSKEVKYPSDDESTGMVVIAWRGPAADSELRKIMAVPVIMEYLTDTAVSPLRAAFVENDDPMASGVQYSLIENKVSCIYVEFETVPNAKLSQVEPKFAEVMKGIAEKPLDMSRMQTMINRKILELNSALENDPLDAIAYRVIGQQLYGQNGDDFNMRLSPIAQYESMKGEPESFWKNLITEFNETPKVVIRGNPSIQLEKQMTEEEKARIAKQKADLGKEGLEKKAKELEEAIAKNEIEAPEEMITKVKVPSVDSIHYHPVKAGDSISNPPLKGITSSSKGLEDINCHLKVFDVDSNFVYFNVLIDTSKVPQNLRPYLPLFMELILESPVNEDGVVTPFEDVVTALSEDTLVHMGVMGMIGTRFRCGSYSQYAVLSLQCEISKYEKGAEWIKKLLDKTEFTVERIKVIAKKMENSVYEMRQQGSLVVKSLMTDLLYKDGSNHRESNLLRQRKFLADIGKKLENGGEAIVMDLRLLKAALYKPETMTICVATKFQNIPNPLKPLKNIPPLTNATHYDSTVRPTYTRDASLIDHAAPDRHIIVGMGGVESSYLVRTCPGIDNFDDPNLAPLSVFIQVLVQLEGPMWKKIRGIGLAYGYSVHPNINNGQLYFTLFKASNIVGAFEEAKKIVNAYVNGKEITEAEFDAAKSSLIFETINKEKAIADAVSQALLSALRGVSVQYTKVFIERVSKVTLKQAVEVGKQYLAPLMEASTKSKTAIVCNPTKVNEVATKFEKLGFNLEKFKSLEETLEKKGVKTNGATQTQNGTKQEC